MLAEAPVFSGSPADIIKVPLIPSFFPRFKIIFKIPPPPSASYRADGLVTTSILSIASAGINRKASTILIALDGFPSIKMVTFSFPRRLTLPSTSTDTDGTLSKTSLTVPPFTIISLPTLYTFLSSLISTVVFSNRITTSSNFWASSAKAILPKLVFSNSDFSLITRVLKEINS